MPDIFENFVNKAVGKEPAEAGRSTSSAPPAATSSEQVPSAASETTAPAPAPAAAKHKTTSKPLEIVNEVVLSNGQQFNFPSWSPIAVSFINRRDSASGWDFIRSMAGMLHRLDYLQVPSTLPAKFPHGKDKSEFEQEFQKISVQASAFKNDLQTAMQAKKKEADQAGKQIDNYDAKEGFGRALDHFLNEAIRKVNEELAGEQSGEGGITFKFDPNLYSDLFPVPSDKVAAFLSQVALLLKDDNSVIMEINPQTRDITLRRKKRMTDGINAMYQAVQGSPQILQTYTKTPVRQ